uniref:NLR family pyrin domain containing 2 n=1 Tax=Cebus imitator TaxID=2715852 RepID=A0A2K5Q8Y1_CEBIM
MVSSVRLDFNLQDILEQLSQDELSQFKSLIRTITPGNELQKIPQTEVDEADGKQLAEILTSHCPSYWVEMATIQVFEKMHRADLSQRVKDELRETIRKGEPNPVDLDEMLVRFEAEAQGKEDRHRGILKMKLQQMWKAWPGDSKEVQAVAQRYTTLIPFSNPRLLPGPFPHTVVLHGPAGLGKTTLAKKLMLDWTEDNLSHKFKYAFYLSCKKLSRLGPCSFAELVFRDWPELQDDIPNILAEAQKILFVVDGLDELGAPPGALIHDICGDWLKPKPVPVLLGSLLKRKMLPKAALLVTTRPRTLKDLQLLAEKPIYIRVEGFLEEDRRAYFLRHFGEEDQATRAFELMRSNTALFQLGSAPAVCWMVCTSLKLQMEDGEDPAPTCHTRTGLFLHFLCSRFPKGAELGRTLRALSLLAAQGLWAQMSVFHAEDLESLGVQESDLRPFLDRGILRQDRDSKDCYSFLHLSFQQFFTALFYALEKEEEEDGHAWDIGDVQKLLSGEERLQNPDLIQAGHFLFGLANEKRATELETTFGCVMSREIKQELLQCDIICDEDRYSTLTDLKEALHCLYESQEEELVKGVMAPLREISLHLSATDIVTSSFCLKHCRSLEKMSLQVIKAKLPENVTASESDAEVERSQDDQHMLPFWTDLCSVFGTNKDLIILEVNNSFLSASLLRILCEQIASDTCHLQRVVLVSCSATTQQWADLSLALEVNQSLTCVNLSNSELLDEGAKLLYATLKHPKCLLQRLSLENCHLTEAICKDLAAVLVVSRELMHLCLAENPLSDTGVKFLCEGLSYPECKLQTLVLWNCDITSKGCCHLAKLLHEKSSLTNLDLGRNDIGVPGVQGLCEALKKPLCNLKRLWLWGCSIPPASCENLSYVLSCNQTLITLDLGQNPLGYSGVKLLFETLTHANGTLQTLRLKIDDFTDELDKLLKEIEGSNPQLTIDTEDQEPWKKRPSSGYFIV